jgi:anti-sigma B factor antagonist
LSYSKEFAMSNVINGMDQFGFLEIRAEREGDRHTVTLSGELDIDGTERVRRELYLAEDSDALEVVLDLSGLSFIDSSGIRLVFEADVRSRANSHRLRLIRGPAQVHRVFVMTDLADRLPFVD